MKIYSILSLVLALLNTHYLCSQTSINVNSTFNYWYHSELYGPGVGFGFSYKKKKVNLSINYDFGYGTINRYKKLDNINYDNWTTVFIKEENGKWIQYLGDINGGLSTELKATTDYGKQHQLSLQLGYSFWHKNQSEFILSTGVYSAIVEQFFTFTNLPIYNIDLSPFYNGPLNYVPSTTQKILTYGVNFEIAAKLKRDSKYWSPYMSFGLGPNYSSYASIGLRLSTTIKNKNSK